MYAVWHSWIRIHKSLRITPAMAAKLTDRLWSWEEIVQAMDADRPPATGQSDLWAGELTACRKDQRLEPARRRRPRQCRRRDRFPSTMPILNIGDGWTPTNRRHPRLTQARRRRRSLPPTIQISQVAFSAGLPPWRVSIRRIRTSSRRRRKTTICALSSARCAASGSNDPNWFRGLLWDGDRSRAPVIDAGVPRTANRLQRQSKLLGRPPGPVRCSGRYRPAEPEPACVAVARRRAEAGRYASARCEVLKLGQYQGCGGAVQRQKIQPALETRSLA
jgi:hypothetical protein